MEEIVQIRKIIHVDMDAFYTSVEQLDNPELLGSQLLWEGVKKRELWLLRVTKQENTK